MTCKNYLIPAAIVGRIAAEAGPIGVCYMVAVRWLQEPTLVQMMTARAYQPVLIDEEDEAFYGPVTRATFDLFAALEEDGRACTVFEIEVQSDSHDPSVPDMPCSPREAILAEAATIITQDRNDQYGEPEHSFATIAQYWTIYLASEGINGVVEPRDVAMMMALLKVARASSDPAKRDSYVDLAGYAACAAEVAEAA